MKLYLLHLWLINTLCFDLSTEYLDVNTKSQNVSGHPHAGSALQPNYFLESEFPLDLSFPFSNILIMFEQVLLQNLSAK